MIWGVIREVAFLALVRFIESKRVEYVFREVEDEFFIWFFLEEIMKFFIRIKFIFWKGLIKGEIVRVWR